MDSSITKVLEIVFKTISLFKFMWILLFSVVVYLCLPEWLLLLLQSNHGGAIPPWVLQAVLSLAVAFFIVEAMAWIIGSIKRRNAAKLSDDAYQRRENELITVINGLDRDEQHVIYRFIGNGFSELSLPSNDRSVISLYAKSVIRPVSDTFCGEAYYVMNPQFRCLVQQQLAER